MGTLHHDRTSTIYVTDGEPLSVQAWDALISATRRINDKSRCHFYRKEYGTCGRLVNHGGSHSYIPIPPNQTVRKDTDMGKPLAVIRAELERIEREEERLFNRKQELIGKVERIERRPKAPDAGGLVHFAIQFDPDGTVYKFAAIQAGEWWYTTSEKFRGPYSWSGLLDLVERDCHVRAGTAEPSIFIVTGSKVTSW